MLKALKVGEEAEQEVIDFLSTLGFDRVYKNEDVATRLYYDVIAEIAVLDKGMDSHGTAKIHFEVKHDVMAARTGNVALEYFNSKQKKASGITATKADWWVHKIDGDFWIIRVSDLLAFTKTAKPYRIINGGGDNNADLLLYKVDSFTEQCRLLTSLTGKDLL